jgi:MGT family glycosyltransferase
VRQEVKRRVVYVTMGTVLNSALGVFRAVVDALADEPVDVVVTVGADQEPAVLGPVPANTRVERFVPQAQLLPDCAVVVHHGGSGTMLGALAHGVPQLVLPQGADNFINAALVRDAGAGTFLGPGEVHPDAVRTAVRALMAEPEYRQAAERCGREIAAMPAADVVAGALRVRYDAGAGGGAAPA